MNLFQIVLLDVILLVFPILVYLIYLSTNKNIKPRNKKIYSSLMLISSFFLVLKYGINEPKVVPILVLNTVVLIAYIEDKWILANALGLCILIIHRNYVNYIYFLIILYIILGLLYLVKKYNKLNNIVFLEAFILLSSLVYLLWLNIFNSYLYQMNEIILSISAYFFILNILYLMYEIGRSIMSTHTTFKELQQEKQIRLSLFKITHEIKNPIAVCKGYLDMINVRDQRQVERYIPIIKSEIERLLSILEDFLLINKSNLNKDIMDINMLLEDTLDKVKPLLKEKNIDVNMDTSEDEVFINGDYNRLSQVLINLIKNSIESISDNGLITFTSKISNHKYNLVICDNGCGMTEDVLDKIKDPFFTTKKRGSGLGVALIYEIIEAHNGSINYESEYNVGTKVTITLPLYE